MLSISLIVPNHYHFDLDKTLSSGQSFRWNYTGDGWENNLNQTYYHIRKATNSTIEMSCNDPYNRDIINYHIKFIRRYFSINQEDNIYYAKLYEFINNNAVGFLRDAAQHSAGIRILRQDPWECLVSFILSQQNNIPRIKHMINKLCRKYGTEISGLHGFPSRLEMTDLYMNSNSAKDDLKFGFRMKYILRLFIDSHASTHTLYEFNPKLSTKDLVDNLKNIYGVGDKIANCVALYGYGRVEAFPVDNWIRAIDNKVYKGKLSSGDFGEYAGIIQQYMYEYAKFLGKDKLDLMYLNEL